MAYENHGGPTPHPNGDGGDYLVSISGGSSSKVPRLQTTKCWNSPYLGGGFKYFLFSPLLGEAFQFD